jgi:hypothetical protein
MASDSTGPTTEISVPYLKNLQSQLQDMLNGVDQQLAGGTDNPYSVWLPPAVDGFQIKAGGTTGSSGSSTFDLATTLTQAISTTWTSITDELTWLKKVLTDMISEISTTITSFGNVENINSETVDQLMQDFQSTITDMNQPAVTSSSSSSSSSSSGPASSGPASSGPGSS